MSFMIYREYERDTWGFLGISGEKIAFDMNVVGRGQHPAYCKEEGERSQP